MQPPDWQPPEPESFQPKAAPEIVRIWDISNAVRLDVKAEALAVHGTADEYREAAEIPHKECDLNELANLLMYDPPLGRSFLYDEKTKRNEKIVLTYKALDNLLLCLQTDGFVLIDAHGREIRIAENCIHEGQVLEIHPNDLGDRPK